MDPFPIKIFTTDGKFVKAVRDIPEAAAVTGADRGNISRCLNNKSNRSLDFVFLSGKSNSITGIAIKEFFAMSQMRLSDYIALRTKQIKKIGK